RSYAMNVATCVQVGSATDVRNVPIVDLLVAGPPCQGFSTLGRRDAADVRNELSLVVLPWAKLSRAKIVLIENVPPFLESIQWRRLARSLRRLGYEVATWQLDAVDFGAPQFRRRAFTVASRIGSINPPEPMKTKRIAAGEALSRRNRPRR